MSEKVFSVCIKDSVFIDPAAGSGNFLTETYLSLRKLENEVLKALLSGSMIGLGVDESQLIRVSIHQFYGIEINDFAVTVAKTALWIAESQMLHQTEDILSLTLDFLPLKSYANIVEGNALRLDWESVVPKAELNYIMGNPPFVGAKLQNDTQKQELLSLYGSKVKRISSVDYVSAWYYKAVEFIQATSIHCAFVSTNSITQGNQVFPIWQTLHDRFVFEFIFAYSSFRWDSEATDKAHVHVVIIGFAFKFSGVRYIYAEDKKRIVKRLNPYLLDADDLFIEARKSPISAAPFCAYGSLPNDGGYYLFSEEEKDAFIQSEPAAKDYFRVFLGSRELINNQNRFCLYLDGISPSKLNSMPMVRTRVEKVREVRLQSTAEPTRRAADRPTQFFSPSIPSDDYIAIPEVSSENRRYIPIAFLDKSVFVSNKVWMVQSNSLYVFGVLTSNVHNAWMRVVSGRMKSDYSYSAAIVYNNFPWPEPTEAQRAKIEQTAQGILDARALYPDCSLADLYDEATMPPALRTAHQKNDRAVMEAYGFWGKLNSESACVAELMKLYQQLTAKA